MLIILVNAIKYFQDPFYEFAWGDAVSGIISVHSLIVLAGGVFIIYTAFKEIFHMLSIEHIEHDTAPKKRSAGAAIFWITLMNLVFSFDSILSAIALTDNTVVMTVAIIVGGVLMIALAGSRRRVSEKEPHVRSLGTFYSVDRWCDARLRRGAPRSFDILWIPC